MNLTKEEQLQRYEELGIDRTLASCDGVVDFIKAKAAEVVDRYFQEDIEEEDMIQELQDLRMLDYDMFAIRHRLVQLNDKVAELNKIKDDLDEEELYK